MSTSAAETAPAQVVPEWSLGDRLRKIRRTTGLSQAEFAAQLGENQKTYASWELDTTAPRNVVAVAKRIEAMTRVPAGWLLDTGFVTSRYPGPARRTGPRLTLVTDPKGGYAPMPDSYGSSPVGSGYTNDTLVVDTAETVNDANAA